MATGIEARAAAAGLLDAVLIERRLLSELPVPEGEPGERARAQRLALTTLRNLDRADAVLKPHLRKAPPPAVHNLLRLGVVEMLGEGAAPHGVVNAIVTLLRHNRRTESFTGLANAVLRKVAETGAPVWAAAPPQALPNWLRGRLMSAWGKVNVQAMEAAHLRGAPLDLTLRTGAEAEALAEQLEASVLPTGSLRRATQGQVSDLPGFGDGLWWIQDAAAALPARLIGAKPGERIADLCAAPGGKTLQLAALGADVTAVDISGPRLARLRENLARTDLSARVVEADLLDWHPEDRFDAILLDAPCTATGTIRRHPDLPFAKGPETIAPLVALQAAMIDRAVSLLAPGGRLVFCTCSLLPDEGEKQLLAALSRHPALRVTRPDLPGIDPGWITPEGGLRLRPDYWRDAGGMDGFFMARLDLATP